MTGSEVLEVQTSCGDFGQATSARTDSPQSCHRHVYLVASFVGDALDVASGPELYPGILLQAPSSTPEF